MSESIPMKLPLNQITSLISKIGPLSPPPLLPPLTLLPLPPPQLLSPPPAE